MHQMQVRGCNSACLFVWSSVAHAAACALDTGGCVEAHVALELLDRTALFSSLLSPSTFPAGIVVVAAAANYQEYLLNYLPAACPTVAAVTAVDASSGAPSAYSNFLPADASDAQKARVIAAPGSGVLSTMSIQRESSRYRCGSRLTVVLTAASCKIN
jgi:hypothetical protein